MASKPEAHPLLGDGRLARIWAQEVAKSGWRSFMTRAAGLGWTVRLCKLCQRRRRRFIYCPSAKVAAIIEPISPSAANISL